MKRFWALLLGLFILSCSPQITETVRTEYIEKEVLKDTIVYVEIPKEIIINKVKDTTSQLENKYSESTAYVDSNGFLNHSLKTKDQNIPFKLIYKDRYITKTDSVVVIKPIKGDLITKEVVPKWSWYSLGITVIVVGYFISRLFSKLITV